MHGEHPFKREQVIHHTENRFFNLAPVPGTAHQNYLFTEMNYHKHFRPGFVQRRKCPQIGCMQHRKFWLMIFNFGIGLRANKQGVGKEGAPGQFADHADGHAVARVLPSKHILHKKVFSLKIRNYFTVKALKLVFFHRHIDIPPGNVLLATGFANNKPVFG